jgi:hypothetical protein
MDWVDTKLKEVFEEEQIRIETLADGSILVKFANPQLGKIVLDPEIAKILVSMRMKGQDVKKPITIPYILYLFPWVRSFDEAERIATRLNNAIVDMAIEKMAKLSAF